MVAQAKNKKNTRTQQDNELGTREHDEILVWLYTNLDEIIQERFARDAQWWEAQWDAAVERFKCSLQGWISKGVEILSLPGISTRERTQVSVKIEATRKLSKSPLPLPTRFIREHSAPRVVHKFMQHAILTPSPDAHPSRPRQPKVVAYVDLMAEIVFAGEISILAPRPPFALVMAGAAIPDTGQEGQSGEVSVKSFLSENLVPDAPYVQSSSVPIYFDIRVAIPAVGALLRDLVELRYRVGKHARIIVVCPERGYEEILREQGFDQIAPDQGATKRKGTA